jgi:Glycosyl transferase family 2
MRPLLAPEPAAPVESAAVPTFSVIIAAYQVADLIGEAIESVLAQTVPPLEIVVCDDGSTDDLQGALAPYRGKLMLLRQPNRGESAAKNAAAAASSGDYVVILDADDVWLPERIEALGELAAARPDVDILTTDAWFELAGQKVGRFYGATTPFVVDGQRTAIFERDFIMPHPAVRRSRWLAIGGFAQSVEYAADWDCWIRLILDGSLAGIVDQPLAHYRLREGSLSAQRAESLRARVTVLERTARHPGLRPDERPHLARCLTVHRRRALLAEAEAALRAGGPEARPACLRVAFGRGFGLQSRLRSGIAALAPRAAGRYLEARERRTGWSRLSRPVPDQP